MLPRDFTQQENTIAQELTKMGIRYEQQAPIGNFTVDILCPIEGIVIEVDGPWGHLNKADRKRDEELLKLGIEKVIHVKDITREGIRQTLEKELKWQE